MNTPKNSMKRSNATVFILYTEGRLYIRCLSGKEPHLLEA